MYVSKNQIVRRIRKAAQNYRANLVGKTFLFIYDNSYIEVMYLLWIM
jgi:ribonuclease P protein component